jgi:hypothetical protein
MTNAGTIPQRVQVQQAPGPPGRPGQVAMRRSAPWDVRPTGRGHLRWLKGGKLVPVAVSYSRSPAPGKAEGMT